jgi:hypothetical protein
VPLRGSVVRIDSAALRSGCSMTRVCCVSVGKKIALRTGRLARGLEFKRLTAQYGTEHFKVSTRSQQSRHTLARLLREHRAPIALPGISSVLRLCGIGALAQSVMEREGDRTGQPRDRVLVWCSLYSNSVWTDTLCTAKRTVQYCV